MEIGLSGRQLDGPLERLDRTAQVAAGLERLRQVELRGIVAGEETERVAVAADRPSPLAELAIRTRAIEVVGPLVFDERDRAVVVRQGLGGTAGADEHLAQILKLLLIEDKMGRKPSELSGGEQQRVAIARSVANKPAILLADEPTGSLDSKNSEIVLNMFRELNRRFKQTIILVTHNPELVTFTDRLIEMRDGVIVSDNDPSWNTESELAQPSLSVGPTGRA